MARPQKRRCDAGSRLLAIPDKRRDRNPLLLCDDMLETCLAYLRVDECCVFAGTSYSHWVYVFTNKRLWASIDLRRQPVLPWQLETVLKRVGQLVKSLAFIGSVFYTLPEDRTALLDWLLHNDYAMPHLESLSVVGTIDDIAIAQICNNGVKMLHAWGEGVPDVVPHHVIFNGQQWNSDKQRWQPVARCTRRPSMPSSGLVTGPSVDRPARSFIFVASLDEDEPSPPSRSVTSSATARRAAPPIIPLKVDAPSQPCLEVWPSERRRACDVCNRSSCPVCRPVDLGISGGRQTYLCSACRAHDISCSRDREVIDLTHL
jgi:hypothetical protein